MLPVTGIPKDREQWAARCAELNFSKENTPFNVKDPESASKMDERQFLTLNAFWTLHDTKAIEHDLVRKLFGHRFEQYLQQAQELLSTEKISKRADSASRSRGTDFATYLKLLPHITDRRAQRGQWEKCEECGDFSSVRWNHLLICEQLAPEMKVVQEPLKAVRTPRKRKPVKNSFFVGESELQNMLIFDDLTPQSTKSHIVDPDYQPGKETGDKRHETVFEGYVLSLHEHLYRLVRPKVIADMPNLKQRMNLHRIMVAIPDAIQRHQLHGKKILNLLEVKTAERRLREGINVRYQETAQLAAFIQDPNIDDDYVERKYRNQGALETMQVRGLYAFGGSQLYFIFAQSPPEYAKYLGIKNVNRVTPWQHKPFMHIYEYGPFNIFDKQDMLLYAKIVLARLLEAHDRLDHEHKVERSGFGSPPGQHFVPPSHHLKTPLNQQTSTKKSITPTNTVRSPFAKRNDEQASPISPSTYAQSRQAHKTAQRETTRTTHEANFIGVSDDQAMIRPKLHVNITGKKTSSIANYLSPKKFFHSPSTISPSINALPLRAKRTSKDRTGVALRNEATFITRRTLTKNTEDPSPIKSLTPTGISLLAGGNLPASRSSSKASSVTSAKQRSRDSTQDRQRGQNP